MTKAKKTVLLKKPLKSTKDKKSISPSSTGKFRGIRSFFRNYWIGTAIILVATLIFFWPLIVHVGNYSEGGDAMFNAWEMSRNQHCILHEGCPVYADANIFFPHKSTMLYSETQLSAGFVTLPLRVIDQNPIFQYNVLTIVSFFLAGWFMYLLAKFLSNGQESVSVLSGLIFAFAPHRMSEIVHLQNLSIFCLPLATLVILKYFETKKHKYLWVLLPTLLYVFFASWNQMVFMLIALGLLLGGCLAFRKARIKQILTVSTVIAVAALATLPLALQYLSFSKTSNAVFNITDQIKYSSSLADYFISNNGTILGKIYYAAKPGAQLNSYNPDSYSYHGLILYTVSILVIITAFVRMKKHKETRNYWAITTFALIGIAGFIMSLGPLLKIKGSYLYPGLGAGIPITLPLPYLLIDKLLPQLSFLRAIGRTSILVLFSLCCLLAFLPFTIRNFKDKTRSLVFALLLTLVIVELMPIHKIPMRPASYSYNLEIPAVYLYIKKDKKIDDIIILRGDDDYAGAGSVPAAATEDILWSGYHNRNIFNGYSGIFPADYVNEKVDFTDFHSDDISKMKNLGLKYVIVDKQLSGPTSAHPQLYNDVSNSLTRVYEDNRYALFKV